MLVDKDTNLTYIADTLRTLRTDVYNRLTKLMSDIGIEVRLLYGTKDIWCRDYMPVQVDKSLFVKYHYAPDYMWSIPKYKNDITDCTDICKSLGIKSKETDLIIDGGNVVLCGDKVVMTDKVFTENRYEKGDRRLLDKLSELFEHDGRHNPMDFAWNLRPRLRQRCLRSCRWLLQVCWRPSHSDVKHSRAITRGRLTPSVRY
ncbi:MAG: hypothetical protein LKE47_11415 [Prevotella sp.]|jgi:hypothetical protein|nr:hypothetical protein [Prevotella sp.]